MCRARQESYLDAEGYPIGEENTRNMGRTGLNFGNDASACGIVLDACLFPLHLFGVKDGSSVSLAAFLFYQHGILFSAQLTSCCYTP